MRTHLHVQQAAPEGFCLKSEGATVVQIAAIFAAKLAQPSVTTARALVATTLFWSQTAMYFHVFLKVFRAST
jgi:hypothetical protein